MSDLSQTRKKEQAGNGKIALSVIGAALICFVAGIAILLGILVAKRNNDAAAYIYGNFARFAMEQVSDIEMNPMLAQMVSDFEVTSATYNRRSGAIDVQFSLPDLNLFRALEGLRPYDPNFDSSDPLVFIREFESLYWAIGDTPLRRSFLISLPIEYEFLSMNVDMSDRELCAFIEQYGRSFTLELDRALHRANFFGAFGALLFPDAGAGEIAEDGDSLPETHTGPFPSPAFMSYRVDDFGVVYMDIPQTGSSTRVDVGGISSEGSGVVAAVLADIEKYLTQPDVSASSLIAQADAPPVQTPQDEPQNSVLSGNTFGDMLPYLIYVSKDSFTIAILGLDDDGEYTRLLHTFNTAVGRTSAQTRAGTFTITERERWHEWESGNLSPYATKHSGGLWFHGPVFTSKDAHSLDVESYNEIGTRATSGCMRTYTSAAAWIYENCADGTTVIIANDSKYTSPRLAALDWSQTYDPSDPDA